MRDAARLERVQFIADIPFETDREAKVREAIEKLGTRYVCHKDNRIAKCPQRTPEIAKTDIRRTFRRLARERDATDVRIV